MAYQSSKYCGCEFLTILVDGIELDNNQQPSGYPRVSEGSSYELNGTQIKSERVTWIIEDEYAKLDQSIVSFSYSRKDTSTTNPILVKIADRLVSGSASGEEEGGLLGLPGFEFVLVLSCLIGVSFSRRKV